METATPPSNPVAATAAPIENQESFLQRIYNSVLAIIFNVWNSFLEWICCYSNQSAPLPINAGRSVQGAPITFKYDWSDETYLYIASDIYNNKGKVSEFLRGYFTYGNDDELNTSPDNIVEKMKEVSNYLEGLKELKDKFVVKCLLASLPNGGVGVYVVVVPASASVSRDLMRSELIAMTNHRKLNYEWHECLRDDKKFCAAQILIINKEQRKPPPPALHSLDATNPWAQSR